MGGSGDRGFLSLGDNNPGEGGLVAAVSTSGGTPGGRTEAEQRFTDVPPRPPEDPFAAPHPRTPASGFQLPLAPPFGGHPAAVPSFGTPHPWPAAFGTQGPHPAAFPGNQPHLVGYGGYYSPPAAFGTNLPQPSPFIGVYPQLPPFARQDPRFAPLGGTPHPGHPYSGYFVNAHSSAAAQGGEGSDARGRGRGRRSGRVPTSPGAGMSRTRSASCNAINIDEDGNAGLLEDDDTDDGSDDETDSESSFPRLMRSIPPWKDKLFEMLKECITDWENTLATTASEPSEVDPISPNTTSGGRKRSSSAATKSTATGPSKKARSGKATQSTAESPSKKLIWVKPGSTRKDKMKVTSPLQKLVVDLDSTDQGPQQVLATAVQIKNQEEQSTNEAIKTCLDLAVASGICTSSPEFFFLTKVFQSEYWRCVFRYFDTPDERLRWIQNAYADPKMH